MAARPLGVCNGHASLHVKFFNDLSSSTLMWNTFTQQRGTPTTDVRVAYFPRPIYKELQGTMTEPN